MSARYWEYRTVKLDDEGWFERTVDFELLDSRLNQLGGEGWELINVLYLKESGWQTNSVIAFLKRSQS